MAGTAFSAANWGGYDEQSATNPGSALTDFTLLIDISTLSSDWKSNVQSDAGDIRCTKGDGTTELATDVIDWAYNAGAPTGWIRVKWSGTLAASGTQNVRVYVSYTSGTAVVYDASETYGSDNAYDASWEQYYPLHDANDRTSNGRTATAGGAPGPTFGDITGKVGSGTSLDGSDDYIDIGDYVPEGDHTLMIWCKPPSSISAQAWAIGSSTTARAYLGWYSDETFYARYGLQAQFASGSVTKDAWNHLAVYYDHSDTSAAAFLDGSASGTSSISQLLAAPTNMNIGTFNEGSNPVAMEVDEMQMHSVIRTVDWIAEEHAQSDDQSTFWGTWAWTGTGSSFLGEISAMHGGMIAMSGGMQ